MRHRGQVKRLAHIAPTAKDAAAAQDLSKLVAAARHQHDIACPVVSAITESIEVSLTAKNIVMSSTTVH